MPKLYLKQHTSFIVNIINRIGININNNMPNIYGILNKMPYSYLNKLYPPNRYYKPSLYNKNMEQIITQIKTKSFNILRIIYLQITYNN